MDEAFDLASYLPVSFKTPGEQEYISFLWETFEGNYDRRSFQFAFLAYHMLMMSFVYFNVWQVRESDRDDFEKGLIGFARDERRCLRDASPFTFSKANERAVLRLFRLIGCNDSQVGNYRKLVDDRNDVAHANGNIYFRSQSEIDAKIQQVLRAVKEIQVHSRFIINRCYEKFLLDSGNPEDREYLVAEDQVREVLVRDNYMSRKDIEVCANFDTASLRRDNKGAIESLHNTLCGVYEISPEGGV